MATKEIIKNVLKQLIQSLENDTCSMTEEDMSDVLDVLRSINDRKILSKYAACQYLNISRAKFDNLVKEGKLPPGIKLPGFKEKVWYRSNLDKSLKK